MMSSRKKVRFLAKHSQDDLTMIVFKHARAHNKRRLRQIGFLNFQPSIRATPALDKEMGINMNIALLTLRPNMGKMALVHAERHMKADKEVEAEMELVKAKKVEEMTRKVIFEGRAAARRIGCCGGLVTSTEVGPWSEGEIWA